MSHAASANDARSDVFFMLISAAAFGYFGFASSWAHQYTNTNPPVLLPMVVILKWTLRGGAIAFLFAVAVTMAKREVGSLIYSLVGLLTAGSFIIVAIWEWTNSQGYYSGVPPFLLVVFAIWNGYGSWSGIKEMLAAMRRSSDREQVFGAGEP